MNILGRKVGIVDVALSIFTMVSLAWLVTTIRRSATNRREVVTVERAREYAVGAFLRKDSRSEDHSKRLHLVIFSDFACPYCKALSDVIPNLKRRYGSDLTVTFRHSPMNRLSASAAAAYECALRNTEYTEQTTREKVFDLTLAMVDSLRSKKKVDLPGPLDLGSEAVRRCISSGAMDSLVSVDQSAYQNLKLSGTPVVIAGQTRFLGYPGLAAIDSALRDVVK